MIEILSNKAPRLLPSKVHAPIATCMQMCYNLKGMCMQQAELLKLLWAIFIAEGACKASVPFGYLPLREKWKKKKVDFGEVLAKVVVELRNEWKKWMRAVNKGEFDEDFVRWLARVGYNANPKEWDKWEKNVRHWLRVIDKITE